MQGESSVRGGLKGKESHGTKHREQNIGNKAPRTKHWQGTSHHGCCIERSPSVVYVSLLV
ncbi:hypothetical protein [Bartonella queenslandensis]|uniref:hypothetical protein n=1 Tax=Bartonella queenslandensis TaxID=481138 RepID=UPI001BA5C4F7|nr:hypothetical protein [Bartonella queenslandensis]